MSGPLSGQVALVTGASRGIGRGIAIGLGEAGATVYITGRTLQPGTAALSGTLPATSTEISTAGGKGIAVACDHRDDAQVAAVFKRIADEAGRLDLLVNNATAFVPYDLLFGETPFWDVPAGVWDDLIDVGVRSHFVAAQHAARMMISQGRGLIVNISSAGAKRRFAILPYGVAKTAVDRMTSDMAHDLASRGVTVVSFWPPATATEHMVSAAGPEDDPSGWSVPEFNGRVIAAMAQIPDLHKRSGSVVVARELAEELGVADPRYA